MKKTKTGVVVSDRMEQTIVVQVEEHRLHPQYRKHVTRHVKFHAHDPQQEAGIGDLVQDRGVSSAEPHQAVAAGGDRREGGGLT